MAKKKKKRTDDFLAGHGMTPEQQHGATMRAAAVPVSDFEGEYYDGLTYNPNSYFSRVMWEARMRKATGIPKLGDQFSGEGETNE